MSDIASAVVSQVVNAKYDVLIGAVKNTARREQDIVNMIKKTVGSGSQPLNASGRGSTVNTFA